VDAVSAVLQAVREKASKEGNSSVKMLFMSSDNVYGHVPADRLPASETEPLHPSNIYGASKAAAEQLIDAYVAQWGLRVLTLRSTTMFGEGSRLRQVVPTFIRQALAGDPITIEGDGSQTRDTNYVKNTALAILDVLNSDITHGVWNIGSGIETTIKDLATSIIELTGSRSKIQYKPWRPGEKGLRLFLSIEKAKREIGYSPRFTQREGLERTVRWVRGVK